MENIIEVNNISKSFKIRKRYSGAVKTFFERKYDICMAVDDISFTIKRGEVVGFIGPNGAGKSTTIKLMTGILQPVAGRIRVLGLNPYSERKTVVRNIGVVFGQRSQLWWDIPVMDSFELLAKIYKVSPDQLAAKLAYFDDYLHISEFWNKPVRQLSLGQKMRAEFVASLLHNPEVVFLDEPTIGLDIVAKREIRNLITKLNSDFNTTIILTSHDMADIEQLAHRIIMISNGKILIDDNVNSIKEHLGNSRTMQIIFKEPIKNLHLENCKATQIEEEKWQIEFDHNLVTANAIIANISKEYTIADLSVTHPSIESIVQNLYSQGKIIK